MKNFLSNIGAGLSRSRIFLLVVVLGVTIVAVPGIQISERRPAFVTDYPRESSQQVLSHGWPLEYLRRSVTIEQLPQGKIEWLSPAAWTLAGNLYEFSLANLLTDLICIALGLLLLAAICWRKPKSKKQRSGWLPKISILQLLLIVGFIGLVLSWYLPHARDRKLEEQGTPYEVSKYEYRGPMWLRRTLGRNSKWLQFCHHRTRLTLDNTLYPTWKKDPVLLVQQCQRAETVSFYNVPDLEILAALKSLPRLQSLTLPVAPDFDSAEYSKIPRLKNANSLQGAMQGRPLLNQDEREGIAGVSGLKRLHLYQVNISFKDLQSLSRLNKLEYLRFEATDMLIDDMHWLLRFENLKEVTLAISAADSELEEFQRQYPHLVLNWKPDPEFTEYDALRLWFQRVAGADLNVYTGPRGMTIDGELRSDHLRLLLRDEKSSLFVSQLEELELDQVDSTETLMNLVEQCPNLKVLDATGLSVSAADLACLPNKIHQLQIEQGELTVTDLQKFIAKMPEDSCLGIYQSDLNYEEAKRIQKSAPNSHLDVYGKTLPGQELFEAEEIYPSWIE